MERVLGQGLRCRLKAGVIGLCSLNFERLWIPWAQEMAQGYLLPGYYIPGFFKRLGFGMNIVDSYVFDSEAITALYEIEWSFGKKC